ncbi:hypothetical protein KGQ20_32225 [Catenulispora sp. NF23]|uniref:hypothetical protein n=1 Tax=Catenulispora pinistramenti TaxID=2705254 RepID=UPI001BA8CC9B|nr:hypothetical protein [Catenulispora pinistramenti]MBS2537431.1 hypothetical protein [Catenulispora pinistramenti]
MRHLRPRTRLATALALATTGLLAVPAAGASAAVRSQHSQGSQHLPVQQSNGYDAACGPAADVAAMAMALSLVNIGNVALYTGAGRTGTGCDVISGDGLPIGTDFQVMGMTAANVDNRADEPVAVYSDLTDDLDAVVGAGTDSDINPVDVNFAAYPQGSTPPPDDRGLIPSAVFHFPKG